MADHDVNERAEGAGGRSTAPGPFAWPDEDPRPDPEAQTAAAPGGFPTEPHSDVGPPPLFWPEAGRPRRHGGWPRWFALFLAALLGAAVAGSATLFVADRILDDNKAVVSGGIVRVAPPVAGEDRPADVVAEVAEKVLPSIVRIDVVQGVSKEGTGSGVIYRSDGYILTNAHVVLGAEVVSVRLATGQSLDAAVVGTAAPAVDIAVLKVAGRGFPAATLGSSRGLRPGDLAVAIGSPFGLQGTVTSGVVSALHRGGLSGEGIPDAIQTDAPINLGNSGGALADARGTVIGINSAIVGGVGGNVGVGFAIPIDVVRRLADQIIRTGRARLPFLGIEGANVPGNGGALIARVEPGSPADGAGLRADDIIVRLDGERVPSMDALIELLLAKDAGQTVTVAFVRDGRRLETRATLAERPQG